jgi:hypothetical protein
MHSLHWQPTSHIPGLCSDVQQLGVASSIPQGIHVRSSTPSTTNFRATSQIAQLRIPPHSIEAESSVLGGLLLDNTPGTASATCSPTAISTATSTS